MKLLSPELLRCLLRARNCYDACVCFYNEWFTKLRWRPAPKNVFVHLAKHIFYL
uniref:Candidate secreted effector n=1 Tax=Meloidogyne incognita TaxID=6306 RepID=A0A914LGH1_MELIC